MPDKQPKKQNDFRGFDDAIEVFRAGEHTSSNGVKRTWSHSDLDEMVANHSAATAAPIVIGHPKDTDPSYGWVDTLTRDGDSLIAKFKDVNKDFAASVENGDFRKRSVRIYKTPDNTLAIEHVGFLGGKRPAIALDALNYSATESDEVYDFEVDAYTPSAVARLFRGVRDLIIDKFGVEAADKTIPDYQIESLSEHATNLRESTAQETSIFSAAADAGDTPNDHTEGDDNVPPITQADLDAAEKKGKDSAQADFSASEKTLQQQLKAEQDKNRKTEHTSFVAGLKCDPAKKEGLVEFMVAIDGVDVTEFEFSAGDKSVKQSPIDFIKAHFSGLKSSVNFNESDAGDGDDATQHDFSTPDGMQVDESQMALHNKALDYQAKHDGVDYNTAIDIVSRESK